MGGATLIALDYERFFDFADPRVSVVPSPTGEQRAVAMVCEAGGDSTDIMPAVCHGAIVNKPVQWSHQVVIKKLPFVMSYELEITGRSFIDAGKIAFIVAGGIVIFSDVY